MAERKARHDKASKLAPNFPPHLPPTYMDETDLTLDVERFKANWKKIASYSTMRASAEQQAKLASAEKTKLRRQLCDLCVETGMLARSKWVCGACSRLNLGDAGLCEFCGLTRSS